MRLINSFHSCMVNILEISYALKEEDNDCEYRIEIEAKNMGKLKMYFVINIKD